VTAEVPAGAEVLVHPAVKRRQIVNAAAMVKNYREFITKSS
jgi:hypothetical protein